MTATTSPYQPAVIPSDAGAHATAREEPRGCLPRKCTRREFTRDKSSFIIPESPSANARSLQRVSRGEGSCALLASKPAISRPYEGLAPSTHRGRCNRSQTWTRGKNTLKAVWSARPRRQEETPRTFAATMLHQGILANSQGGAGLQACVKHHLQSGLQPLR
jgi:hypothetical protein